MSGRISIDATRILAVEGKDECNFFKAFLKHEGISDVQVIDIGGKDKFKLELPLLINTEGFLNVKSLGFIRDAEENQARSAFKSICDILWKNGLSYPSKIDMISETDPKVGIFIMPNNIDEGMLEDLCLVSVKENAVFHCVESYIECCLACLSENDAKINIPKAKVQAYLSSRRPIANSLGVAALKGHWNFDDCCFDGIKEFLSKLFHRDI